MSYFSDHHSGGLHVSLSSRPLVPIVVLIISCLAVLI